MLSVCGDWVIHCASSISLVLPDCLIESIRCCVKDSPIEVSILVIEVKHLLIIGGSYQVGYVLYLYSIVPVPGRWVRSWNNPDVRIGHSVQSRGTLESLKELPPTHSCGPMAF